MRALLLPGLDGTGTLFDAFAEHLGAGLEPSIVSYPPAEPLGYAALADLCRVPDEPFVVVAESFSGPLGIELARRAPHHVRALVLVASFVRCPNHLLRAGALFLHPAMFAHPMPDAVLRAALLGAGAQREEVDRLRSAIASVSPAVVCARLRFVRDVDVVESFASLPVPVLYVAGQRDRLVPPRIHMDLKRLRPDLEVSALDAPHLVLQTRPAEAAFEIRRFLRRHALDGG